MRSVVAGLIASLLLVANAVAGAWGPGSFENDDALDWVAECVKARSADPVRDALKVALNAEYIEIPVGSAAIAAAEVVAAALGKPSLALPPKLGTWIERQPPRDLVRFSPLARRALARILNPEVSELSEANAEAKSRTWADAVRGLGARLSE